MILVAAGVFIKTGETLQQIVNKVGLQTTREISSGLVITDVTGCTNNEKTYITYLALIGITGTRIYPKKIL